MRAKSEAGEKNAVSDGSEEKSLISAWSGVEAKMRTVLLWGLQPSRIIRTQTND